MTPSAALLAAADLLAQPGAWTQHVTARSAGGVVSPDDKRATSWCAAGALLRVTGGASGPLDRAAWDRLVDHLEIRDGLVTWNDQPGRTQAEVVATLRAAAVAAEAAHV